MSVNPFIVSRISSLVMAIFCMALLPGFSQNAPSPPANSATSAQLKTPTTTTKTVTPASTSSVTSTKPSEKLPDKPAEKRPPTLLKITLSPQAEIYSSHQGLMMTMVLQANQRAKVCLAKDIMTQMDFKVSQAGVNLPLKPLVVNDNSTIFQQPVVIKWLDPGQKLTYRINLKRFQFADGQAWKPAEYHVSATYHLCEQNDSKTYDPAGDEIPIKTQKPAWFMIMS